MSDQKDDKTLEEYLKGGSKLSGRYQAVSEAEPPKKLDAAIIQAARSAVAGPAVPVSRSWYVPLSLAAVVVIGVSVVFRMYKDQGQQLLSEPVQFHMLEEKSDSDVPGGNDSKGPAEQAAATAPAPPAHQLKPERNKQREELKRSEINTASALKREAEKMSAEVSRKIEMEKSISTEKQMQQFDLEADLPSMDSSSTRVIQATDFPVEQKLTPAATAPLSDVELEGKNQPATIPEETGQLSDTLAAKSLVMSETDWLGETRQLWETGMKDEAVASLKQFLMIYPHYPHEAIITQLPVDFDPAKYVSDFEKY